MINKGLFPVECRGKPAFYQFRNESIISAFKKGRIVTCLFIKANKYC